jgi:hypothetical protein
MTIYFDCLQHQGVLWSDGEVVYVRARCNRHVDVEATGVHHLGKVRQGLKCENGVLKITSRRVIMLMQS